MRWMTPEMRGRELQARLGVNARRTASCAYALAGLMWGIVGSAIVGCGARPGEGRSLGADLGTFSVDAEREANTCGADALGNPSQFAFDVELARLDTELFWDGSGGRLGAGLDFELSASVRLELRAPRGAIAGCSIARDDRIAGVLDADDTGAITSFTGEMDFAFASTPESSCTLEESEAADLPQLPCRMSYALDGRRTRVPMP
jgi:hypothetical protein